MAPRWAQLYASRRAARDRFGAVWALPLRRRHTEVAMEWLGSARSVLEVGAHDRRLAAWLAQVRPGVEYHSSDPDPSFPHDYPSLEAVDRRFGAVWLFEVIEHLGLEEGLALLERLRGLLEPGAPLVLSTPNVHHPSAFLHDATHRTAYAHDELAGVLTLAGYEVRALYRLYQAPWLWRCLRRGLAGPLHRLLGVDYARGICAVGAPKV
ncbi:MAG: methyltransferase domain-containing protein [Planctomycetes bacterium]|nr:methyltransferase domain-containing protein [Planctomycetota bacterium]